MNRDFDIIIRSSFREYYGSYDCNELHLYDIKDYINLYKKYDKNTGYITIYTDGSDSICSYYKKRNGIEATTDSFITVPPHTEITVFTDEYEELYIYESGVVRVYKEKLKNINIPEKVSTALIVIAFLLPLLALALLQRYDVIDLNGNEGIIYVAYIALGIFLADKKYYKEKHYDKQRKIYFDGYKQGKQDAYQKQKQKKNEED